MALLRCDFFAESLELATSMTVLLPQPAAGQVGVGGGDPGGAPPLLYLLHGLTDDDTAWTRYTALERLAAERGLAVVMPQVHRSFYADEASGGRYWTFLTEELPATVARFFRVTADPARTYVAGLSMGGYGALKWALRHPDRFGFAASLSGALDLARLQREDTRGHIVALLRRVFAGPVAGTGDDLLHLVAAADPAVLPPLLLRCGTQDPLRADNETFAAACRDRGVALDAAFTPGGHEWAYWDGAIRTVLDRLPPG